MIQQLKYMLGLEHTQTCIIALRKQCRFQTWRKCLIHEISVQHEKTEVIWVWLMNQFPLCGYKLLPTCTLVYIKFTGNMHGICGQKLRYTYTKDLSFSQFHTFMLPHISFGKSLCVSTLFTSAVTFNQSIRYRFISVFRRSEFKWVKHLCIPSWWWGGTVV